MHTPEPMPAAQAMWAAHEVPEAKDVPPEVIEKIAVTATSVFLTALAKQNTITTEVRENQFQGDQGTTLYRPVYPQDLRREASQLGELGFVGKRPEAYRRLDSPW